MLKWIEGDERLLFPRRLLILSLVFIYGCAISFSLFEYLINKNFLLSFSVLPFRLFYLFILTIFLKIGWKYIFGVTAQEYKGLSNREKGLYEETKRLSEENEVLRKFAGFKYLLFPKVLVMVIGALLVSMGYAAFVFIADGQFGTMTPVRITIYFLSALAVGFCMLAALIYLIFGKRTVEFCLNCDRIKVKNEWKHLTSFGNFSHSLCDICANALIDRHRKEAGNRVGDLLIKRGIISQKQLNEALEEQRTFRTKRVGDILLEKRYLTEETLSQALNEQLYLLSDLKEK